MHVRVAWVKLVLAAWWACHLSTIIGLRKDDEYAPWGDLYPLIVDYSDYHYNSIKDKMNESMSVNNCTIVGQGWSIGERPRKPDLRVRVVAPSNHVRARWGYLNHERGIETTKIFFHVSTNLCSHHLFIKFAGMRWWSAKGCYSLYRTIKGVVRKAHYRHGATLHPQHRRCDVAAAVAICAPGQESPKLLDSVYRKFHNYPFLVKTTHGVLVSRSGMLSFQCGPFGLLASCEALKWGIPTANETVQFAKSCQKSSGGPKCGFRSFDRIFAISQYDDTQIGQFILESLPRLVYHLDYILANPDVKIHFGFTKQPTVPDFVLPHIILEWLGVRHRLVNGTVYAREVLMPREGGCQEATYNAWELVNQRETFLQLSLGSLYDGNDDPDPAYRRKLKLFENIDPQFPNGNIPDISSFRKPVVLILRRNPASRYVQNQMDQYTRMWPNNSLPTLTEEFQRLFPNHEVQVFSDKDAQLMNCPPCQVRLFSRAEVVVGMHGAGMTNCMYMRRGGVVVEVLPYFDSRHGPVTGIFPGLSAMIGLHHFTYLIAGTMFDPYNLAAETAEYYRNVNRWSEE